MRRDIEVVSLANILLLWSTNRLDEKLGEGVLSVLAVYESPATNPKYKGGTSRILKILTLSGQHIGTVHEIVMPDGSRPHRHPKDYTRRDCSRVRLSGEPESGQVAGSDPRRP